MDLTFLFFIFLSTIVSVGGAFYFVKTHQVAGAGIYFVCIVLAMIFFGMRWFNTSGNQVATGSWPPVINVCPDFLSLYTLADTNEQVCIDTIGIAPSGGISKWTDTTNTDEKYLFHLMTSTTAGADRATGLCQQCLDKKVTWEGVFDGSICLNNDPPKPAATTS